MKQNKFHQKIKETRRANNTHTIRIVFISPRRHQLCYMEVVP